LLLTGTPSKFNCKPDEFHYHHVSVYELRKVGKLTNARSDIVSSDYNMEGQDILRNGNLHTRVTDNVDSTISSFHKLCISMLQTLGNVEGNDVKSLFEHLDKTIIFCNSQFQANQFYNILKHKMKGQVLKSLSSDGGDSEEFDVFKQNPNVKVLILVRKGRLGFDMDNLYNIQTNAISDCMAVMPPSAIGCVNGVCTIIN
jgi:ribosomal silencing factor RsfS